MTGGDDGARAGDSGEDGSGDAGGAEWAGPPAGEGDDGAERDERDGPVLHGDAGSLHGVGTSIGKEEEPASETLCMGKSKVKSYLLA
jgi:hypothetical protein